MKKIITILTTILVLIFSFSAGAYAAEINFTDVKSDDWFYKNLQELTEKKIACGYPDGTFKPGNTLKFEEFIKMLVVATEDELAEQKEGQEWYQIYIEKAFESKYITEQQKALIGQNIDRQTMAEILYNVLTEKEDIKVYTDAEFEYLSDRLTDVNKTDFKTLTINGIGIISGYPDGAFKPANTLTRAEAVAVISRVIKPELRKPVKIAVRDANGIIDAKDLESIPVVNTNYDELKKYTETDLHDKVTYKVEDVIKADTSMFPIRYGGLVITGIEKLPAEKAPYYGDTSIKWNGFDETDAIIVHAYPVEKSDNNESTTGYSPGVLRGAFIYKSGEMYTEAATTISTSYGGDKVYKKIEKMFPYYVLGEYPWIKLYQQFTTMIIGKEGAKSKDIDKIILMDTRGTYYPEVSTNDVLEIDANGIKDFK